MSKALALIYRPTTWDDVTEQGAVKAILENQINTGTIKQAYLFCGPAGCGKTTAARIFAKEINKGLGEPIELDAASNNSVDDIREITAQAQSQALVGEYKVFILDEVHSLSSQAWQAFLKTLEEPPAKAVFIMCTTNPERIPATILSRAQIYNFRRISLDGIFNRLRYIIEQERGITYTDSALQMISRLADGGMRDAITLLDKTLSYTKDLTDEAVIEALGVADYDTMLNLNEAFFSHSHEGVIEILDKVYASGSDLKLFIKNYFEFMLDANVYWLLKDITKTKLPQSCLKYFEEYGTYEWDWCFALMKHLNDLQSRIKWEKEPRAIIMAEFILLIGRKSDD